MAISIRTHFHLLFTLEIPILSVATLFRPARRSSLLVAAFLLTAIAGGNCKERGDFKTYTDTRIHITARQTRRPPSLARFNHPRPSTPSKHTRNTTLTMVNSRSITALGALTAASLSSLVSAHAHEGVGFHVPHAERAMNEVYLANLRARFGEAPARVVNAHLEKRQAMSTGTSAAASAASTGGALASTGASGASAAPTANSTVTMGTIPIGITTTIQATSPLPTTYVAGTTAPIEGAPVLPVGEWQLLFKSLSALVCRVLCGGGGRDLKTKMLLHSYIQHVLTPPLACSQHQPRRLACTRPHTPNQFIPGPGMDIPDRLVASPRHSSKPARWLC